MKDLDVPGLCSFTSVENAQQCLDIFSEFFFDVIEDHVKKPTNKVKLLEAKLLLQMVFTKILHLKNILNGISFQKKNIYLNKIIDPGVVAIIIRNLYETIGLFHLIYIHPDTEEQQDLIYDLWCHSGMKYRQTFDNSSTATDQQDKIKDEKATMQQIEEEIKESDLYKNFSLRNQQKIDNRLERKEYLLSFEGNDVKVLHWHDLIDLMNLKKDIFGDLYTYFSLYTHPSNVNVFQFQDLFKPTLDDGYSTMVVFNMKVALCFLGVFAADYIKLFPDQLSTFNNLKFEKRAIIDFYNVIARGNVYSIDITWGSYKVKQTK